MKMFRRLLVVLGCCSALGSSAQSCYGDYTSVTNGNTVDFSGTVSLNVNSIVWDFGDGNFDYSNSISATHSYTSPGTYQACIQVYDSLNACADSTCHMIYIDSCFGSFYCSINGLTGNFYGFANGSSPNTVYIWNFGDAGSSYQQNPTHTYAYPGTYTVCFAYYDMTTGCSDSICMPYTFGGCTADFSTVDSMGYVYFINTSSLGSNGIYYWDFGDGNTSTQQNPSNTYDSIGTYLVCLIAYDSMQNFCDSTCHYISVTNVASVSENLNSISALSISPNPSDENATISFSLAQACEMEISIYDISGRAILSLGKQQFSEGKQKLQINTQGISSGTYFVQMNFDDQVNTNRMIITHKQ